MIYRNFQKKINFVDAMKNKQKYPKKEEFYGRDRY